MKYGSPLDVIWTCPLIPMTYFESKLDIFVMVGIYFECFQDERDEKVTLSSVWFNFYNFHIKSKRMYFKCFQDARDEKITSLNMIFHLFRLLAFSANIRFVDYSICVIAKTFFSLTF